MFIHFRQENRLRNSLLMCCAVLILLIGGWIFLDYGKWRSIYQEMAEAISKRALPGASEQRKQLADEVENFRNQVTVLERAAQVDKAEQKENKKLLADLQQENYELRQELGFYKNIMPDVSDVKGLKISGFRLEKLNEKQGYQIAMILTRIVKGGTVAKGDISITLHGREDENARDYDIKELLAEKDKALSFKIKHFKKVNYIFSLPDSFQPDSLTVVLKQHDSKNEQIKKIFQWEDIQA